MSSTRSVCIVCSSRAAEVLNVRVDLPSGANKRFVLFRLLLFDECLKAALLSSSHSPVVNVTETKPQISVSGFKVCDL